MNFGSRSEKVSRRIAQMEADLNRLQKESDTLTGRVYDPAVQRPLRQTRTRKPFPESLPRDEKRLLPAAPCCPNCGGSLSYLGEDTAEQLELMRRAFRVIRTVREKHACTQCDAIVQAPAPSRPIERGIAGPGLLARVLTSKYAEHGRYGKNMPVLSAMPSCRHLHLRGPSSGVSPDRGCWPAC
nr:IS66 family transposase zinc-finger binding domain-containing protein [Escherichia coli]